MYEPLFSGRGPELHPSVEATAREVLTERQRHAYTLHVRGYGYRRIARALGISVKTAEQRVMAAERNMRRAMRRRAEEAGESAHFTGTGAPLG
jgi:DNA-directed RNA polymerase specialized sigma24 family protein